MTAGFQPGVASPTAIPLRPRSVSELVDAAFQLLRRDYLQHVLVVALPMVPWLVASMFYMRMLGIDPNQPELSKLGPAYWAFSGIGGSVLYVLLEGAMVLGVSDAYFGRPVDVWNVHGRAFARLLAMFGAGLLRNLTIFGSIVVAAIGMALLAPAFKGLSLGAGVGAVFVAIFLVIVPPIYFAARYFATLPALLLEDIGPIQAMKRSAELTKGEFGRVIKAMLLMFVLYIGFTIAVLLVIGAFMAKAASVGQVLAAVANVLVLPVFGAIQTLLYYDLRIRKEGYDIEVMSQALGASTVPGAVDLPPA
jgi:hypothetical protein